jgi:predicted transcriptional regulator
MYCIFLKDRALKTELCEGGTIMYRVREEAKKLLDKLPDEASWDDVMYEIYAVKKIEQGLRAAEEGKVVSHDEVKKRFLKR